MLCHMLPMRLPPHVETVYIANPSVSPEEILHTIAFELQLAVDRGATRVEVMQALHDFLLERYAVGKRVVVFVEESQSMPLPTLEEIRLLSNLETSNDKLMQIVLFGQPELDDNLRQPNIRQLRERITHSFQLEPLSPSDIHEYLMFRLRAAGYHGPDLFSAKVVQRIANASEGLSRRVNLIADKALLVAFSENTHTIRGRHVAAAVHDSEFSRKTLRPAQTRYVWAAGLVATGAALGVGAYMLLERNIDGGAARRGVSSVSAYSSNDIYQGTSATAPVGSGVTQGSVASTTTNVASPTTTQSPPIPGPSATVAAAGATEQSLSRP